MAYVKTIWVDDETVVNAQRMNHIEDGIKNLESISLLAVSDTAPSECVEGDLYYNTTTKKIYQAIDTNTWDSEGTDPIDKILYIVFSTKTTYSLDENGDLISVGGGGAEIAVSTTEPEEDEVLWIDPEEDSVDAEGTYISDDYGVSTEKGYSQKYLNNVIVSEKGQVIANDFTDYTFGSETYSYYHVDFTKTYTNLPIVIINGVDISSKGYWGTLDQFFIKDLTNTGMNIVMNRPKNEPSGSSSKVYVNYIIISND